MTTYLGLDIGTSSVKAVLVGDGEKIIATASASLEVSRPHAGWSEQDGDSWIAATQSAIDQLKVSHPKELSAVAGIGLSGQMHGATLLDKADKPLRPAILWNDVRSRGAGRRGREQECDAGKQELQSGGNHGIPPLVSDGTNVRSDQCVRFWSTICPAVLSTKRTCESAPDVRLYQ